MVSEVWSSVQLSELVKITHGYPFKSEFFSDELTGRPIVVNIGNFKYTGGFRFDDTLIREYQDAYPDDYVLIPGDILLVMTCQTSGGEILGIPGRIPDDGRIYLHNQRLGKVLLLQPDVVDQNFLYWLFLSPEFNRELVSTATGTKILHTAPSRIEAFRFNLPPLAEQRAIASILGSLDDKIELNRRMNATLEETARALFKSWFVDFDPVRAKMEGRQPAGIDAETAALFPDRLVESELGLIPEGWRVKPLDEIADFQNGLALQKFPPIDAVYLPVIKIRELRQGCIDDNSDKATPNIRESCIVYDGDVLFSWSGSLMIDLWCGGTGALNQHLFKVTSSAYPKWFYLYWTYHHLDNFIGVAADKATTMGHIQRHHLSSALTVVPPNEVLDHLGEMMSPLVDKIILSRLETRTLAEARDTLLPKLLSGQVRVGNVNITNLNEIGDTDE